MICVRKSDGEQEGYAGERRTDLSGDYLRGAQDGYKWAEVGTSIGPCPVSIIDTTYVDPLQYG